MAVKRKSRGSRKPRRSSRSSRRSTKLVDPSAKRVGSPHEEHIRGLGSYCNVCGYIDDANPSDPLIRKWHSDSFGDSRRPSHRRHGNAVPQFNRGEEVTVIRPTRMDIGRGKQMYQPGSIYGTISQLTPSAALVFWYQHPNAPTWHNFEDSEAHRRSAALYGASADTLRVAWLRPRGAEAVEAVRHHRLAAESNGPALPNENGADGRPRSVR